jgi:hypothetical protein
MCRNIKPLFNFDPPASDEEIRDAALQFVRKISGYNNPSSENEDAFYRAVESIAGNIKQLLVGLRSKGAKKDREVEKAKTTLRNKKRFAVQ